MKTIIKNSGLRKSFISLFGNSVKNVYLFINTNDEKPESGVSFLRKNNDLINKQFENTSDSLTLDIGFKIVIEFNEGNAVLIELADGLYPMCIEKVDINSFVVVEN